MATITQVAITSGIPSSGTGEVATINAFVSAAGTPSSLAATVQNSSVAFTVTVSTNPVYLSSQSGQVSVALSSGDAGVTAITSAINSGIITTGSAGTPSSQYLSVQGSSAGSAIPTTLLPISYAGGLSVYTIVLSSAASAAVVSTAPCQLYGVEIFNNSTNFGFFRTYNLSSVPTAGTSTYRSLYMTPGNSNGAGLVTRNSFGVPYTTGLGYVMTGAVTSTDTTDIVSSQFSINIYYK